MKKRVLLLILVVALIFAVTSCHKHSFEQTEVIKEATCDSAGQAKFVCNCGEEETREIPAKGHTFGEAQVVEPSCYKDGYTFKVCTVCEAESDHTDVKPKGDEYHEYEEKTTTEPNCEANTPGKKEWVCKHCKKTDPTRPATNIKAEHDYETTTVDATCQSEGSISEICKVCGAPGKTEVIPQLEHTAVKVAEREADCENPARIEYYCSVCQHEWSEGDGEGLGHEWSEEKTHEPTCTVPGYRYKECTRPGCGKEEPIKGSTVPANGHTVNYDDPTKVEIVEPTCITPGTITPICTKCGEKVTGQDNYGNEYVKSIDPTGVHFTEKEKIGEKSATCHGDAYVEYVCRADGACTETNKEYAEKTKLEHNFQFVKTVAPTCLAEGYDLYVCTICEDSAQELDDCEFGCVEHRNIKGKVDHEENLQEKVDVTCHSDAYEVHICGVCGTRYKKVLPDARPDHDFSVNTNEVKHPTCSSEGYTVYKCSTVGCTEETHKDIKRRIAHAFDVYEGGRYVCTSCNVTYRDISTYIDKAIDEGYMPVVEVEKVALSASKPEYVFTATEAGKYTAACKDGVIAIYVLNDGEWVSAEGADLTAGGQLKVVATGNANVSIFKAFTWELKGYGDPADVEAINKDEATVIFESNGSSSMSQGIVRLMSNDASVEYTIVVELANGEAVTYTTKDMVDSIDAESCKYIDLYGLKGVEKITVTATAGASYIICTNEG